MYFIQGKFVSDTKTNVPKITKLLRVNGENEDKKKTRCQRVFFFILSITVSNFLLHNKLFFNFLPFFVFFSLNFFLL